MKSLYSKYKELTQKELNDEFIKACSKGDLKVVKCLLTSPKLPLHAEIGSDTYLGYRWACSNEQIEVVKYLLQFPSLDNFVRPLLDEHVFCNAIINKSYTTIKFFIFELNIERTEEINHQLKKTPNEKIEHWFNMREVNKNLIAKLSPNPVKNKKPKV